MKKGLVLSLTLVLAMMLTGCGNKEEAGSTKIKSCPNCVFAFDTDYKKIGEDGDTVTNYTKNYTELKDYFGEQRNVFLGYVLDKNKKINKAYICVIRNEGPICVESAASEEIHKKNKDLLDKTLGDKHRVKLMSVYYYYDYDNNIMATIYDGFLGFSKDYEGITDYKTSCEIKEGTIGCDDFYECPGEKCVYTFYDGQIYDGIDGYVLKEYTKDYKTLKDDDGNQRKVFLGFTLDDEGKINKGYLCGIEKGEIFCISSEYNYTKEILKKTFDKDKCDDSRGYRCEDDVYASDNDGFGWMGDSEYEPKYHCYMSVSKYAKKYVCETKKE